MKFAACVAALVALMSPSSAKAQTPFPTPEQILPPAPAWSGASERLIAPADHPWITPSERTGLTATPTYDETIAWLRKLDAASPLIRMERFGKTAQGRDLWVVTAAKGGRLDPAKPTLLAQAGIHSGEIDGKDAGLMLLRDIAFRGKAELLDGANLLFVPVFNADGHERTSPYSRPNQRGPVSQGWRTTAQNLNLNRDYLKADSPEMRAMISLLRKHDPDLYLDLHVTDGHDHQYDVTFDYNGWGGRGARSTNVAAWLDRTLGPALTADLKQAGHIPGPYADRVDVRRPEAGLSIAPSAPRFSTGYGDLIAVPTVLLETHSLKPYRQRVLGTYVFVESALRTLAREGTGVRRAKVADRNRRPETVVVATRPGAEPVATVEYLPIAAELYDSPVSGRQEVRYLGRPAPALQVPVFSSEPAASVRPPAAYWVPPTKPEVIERLALHGVRFERLTEPRTLEVEVLRFGSARPAAAANEGHVGVEHQGVAVERRRETYPPGSARVHTDQPLGELAVMLLEPESADGLWAWGFFPEVLQRTEYIEGYAMAPLAQRMLAADPKLKAAWEAALAADPKLAADPDARLSWFYRRTPYYDERHLLYPVGRER
jgi:murein tripeptide amidase MpaA